MLGGGQQNRNPALNALTVATIATIAVHLGIDVCELFKKLRVKKGQPINPNFLYQQLKSSGYRDKEGMLLEHIASGGLIAAGTAFAGTLIHP